MSALKLNVTEQVVEYLKENINIGSWRVGEKIPSENQLTDILKVSRSSVRTAIQQLVGVGALESIHGKGTFVTTHDLSALINRSNGITEADCRDIKKVLEFRCVFEPETCYLASQRISPEGLSALVYHLGMMKQSVGHQDIFVRHDMLFHQEISKASGNNLLNKSLRDVFEQTISNHVRINDLFGYKDGIYYHSVIIRAMQDKQASKARKLMYEHLHQAIERI